MAMNYASMFSGAGIGETYLADLGFNLVVSSELIENRAKLHKHFYNKSLVIHGDITKTSNYNLFKKTCIENNVEFILATPPCQGFSLAGKNKNIDQMLEDRRNYLIFTVIDMIKDVNPSYILIENVPRFIKMGFPYKDKITNVVDIIADVLKDSYDVNAKILNAKHYGIPQNRERSFIKIYKKGLNWELPQPENNVYTIREAIGHLPSIESGEISNNKLHFGRKHSEKHIEWMKHTPSGKSAFENKIFYPQDNKGQKINGFSATYQRMDR